QRHRNGEQRNQAGAPGLQKQQHHQHDQADGFVEGVDHALDRLADEDGRVVHDLVLEALGELLRQLLHRLQNRLGGRPRVRPGPLQDRDRYRWLIVQVAVDGVVAGAELDAGDVADADDAAVLAGLDHHLLELLRRQQSAERRYRQLERFAAWDRWLADDPG